jgi:hypothetical protein
MTARFRIAAVLAIGLVVNAGRAVAQSTCVQPPSQGNPWPADKTITVTLDPNVPERLRAAVKAGFTNWNNASGSGIQFRGFEVDRFNAGAGMDLSVGVVMGRAQHRWRLHVANAEVASNLIFNFGVAEDLPVVGDWNGDGIDTVGTYRASEAGWRLRNSNSAGEPDVPLFLYGLSGDIAITGNWNGQ